MIWKKNLYFLRFGNSCKYLIIEIFMNDKWSMEIKDVYCVYYIYYLVLNVFCECEICIWSIYLYFLIIVFKVIG